MSGQLHASADSLPEPHRTGNRFGYTGGPSAVKMEKSLPSQGNIVSTVMLSSRFLSYTGFKLTVITTKKNTLLPPKGTHPAHLLSSVV
jgi:hypothetical protein